MTQRRALIKPLAWVRINPGNKSEPLCGGLSRVPAAFSNVREGWTVSVAATEGQSAVKSPGRVLNNRFQVTGGRPIRPQPRRGQTDDEWDGRRAAWPSAYRTCSPLSVGCVAKSSPRHLRKLSSQIATYRVIMSTSTVC